MGLLARLGAVTLVVALAGCTSGTTGSPSEHTPTPTPTPTPTTSVPSTPADSSSASLSPSVDSSSASSSAAVQSVDVVVTRAAWDASSMQVSANAIIPDAVVSGGTCRLTLTMGSHLATTSRTATATADSTQCGVLTFPGSQLTPGTWTAVVTFTAPTAAGTSSPVPVTVTG